MSYIRVQVIANCRALEVAKQRALPFFTRVVYAYKVQHDIRGLLHERRGEERQLVARYSR